VRSENDSVQEIQLYIYIYIYIYIGMVTKGEATG
jgi:hypothetical protein